MGKMEVERLTLRRNRGALGGVEEPAEPTCRSRRALDLIRAHIKWFLPKSHRTGYSRPSSDTAGYAACLAWSTVSRFLSAPNPTMSLSHRNFSSRTKLCQVFQLAVVSLVPRSVLVLRHTTPVFGLGFLLVRGHVRRCTNLRVVWPGAGVLQWYAVRRYGYKSSLRSSGGSSWSSQSPLAFPEVEGRWRLRGAVCAFAAVQQHFPLVPAQRQSNELQATTVGEWWRRHSLRRHKGGLWTVRLSSFHRVLLQGGFFILRRRDPLSERGHLSSLVKDMLTHSVAKVQRGSRHSRRYRKSCPELPGPSGLMTAYEQFRRRHALLREVSKWHCHSRTRITGARTRGIVGMLGPKLLVSGIVGMLGQLFNSRVGSTRKATNPKTGRHRPEERL